jgi:hypothetical protein
MALPGGAVSTMLVAITPVPRDYRFEIRTAAGPSRHVQCVFTGGPYTVWPHVRHVQVVYPPPWPRPGLVTDKHR